MGQGTSDRNGDTANARNPAIARFGVFELDLRTAELRRHGVKLRLQRKAFQFLQTLANRLFGIERRMARDFIEQFTHAFFGLDRSVIS